MVCSSYMNIGTVVLRWKKWKFFFLSFVRFEPRLMLLDLGLDECYCSIVREIIANVREIIAVVILKSEQILSKAHLLTIFSTGEGKTLVRRLARTLLLQYCPQRHERLL